MGITSHNIQFWTALSYFLLINNNYTIIYLYIYFNLLKIKKKNFFKFNT